MPALEPPLIVRPSFGDAQSRGLSGRYLVCAEIAQGGMASVHLGRLESAVGFSRAVAIKRLHSHYAKDPDFLAMFMDEVRLAARVRHPNVVSTIDVVSTTGELMLVMEYVHGETLARLMREAPKQPVPLPIAAAIISGVLRGLHAAHEAKNPHGEPLALVHRDVSPQNVLVGTDGTARVLDFGVAKASDSGHTTQDGVIKGKIGYMSPEQIYGEALDRRSDIFAVGVVLWELLVGERLFAGESNQAALAKALTTAVEPPGVRNPSLPAAVDEIVMRALERDAHNRYLTALEMATVLEGSVALASPTEVGRFVESLAGNQLVERARLVAEVEAAPPRGSRSTGAQHGRRSLRSEAIALVGGLVLSLLFTQISGAHAMTPALHARPKEDRVDPPGRIAAGALAEPRLQTPGFGSLSSHETWHGTCTRTAVRHAGRH